MIRTCIRILPVLLVALGTFAVHRTMPPTLPAERDEVFLPKPELAKVAALGFESVLADYYWIQAMYKVGVSHDRGPRFSSYVAKIIDVVTTLDPWMGHPYRFAAIWLTDSVESVRKANGFLEQAIEYEPDLWRNYFYLGYNHFYYLQENEKAAEILEQCMQLEGSPHYIPRLVARLRSEHSNLAAAQLFLQELYQSAQSDDERASYQAALDEIEVENKARMLDRARASYGELYGKDIEEVLDLITGPHPIVNRLPRPEPDALPATRRKGDKWYIDSKTRRITSSYYGRRYRLNMTAQSYEWTGASNTSEADREGIGGDEI
jgi:tetratricopeptide (TPR) repeat protein